MWIRNVYQDARLTIRSLRRSPWLCVTVTASLAVGIAAVLGAVAFINGLLLRDFPGVMRQSELAELKILSHCGTDCWAPLPTTLADYTVLRDALEGAADLAVSTLGEVTVQLSAARSVRAAFVSDNYLATLGARPIVGRFADSNASGDSGAVISHGLWVREFGREQSIGGRSVVLASQSLPVMGVTESQFGGLDVRIGQPGPDIWLPVSTLNDVGVVSPAWQVPLQRGKHYFRYIARIGGGRDIRQLRSQAPGLAAAIIHTTGATANSIRVDVISVRMHDAARFGPLALLIFPIPLLVLAIACMNVANLLFARASMRAREVATCLALGASRARLVQMLLLEGLILATPATALGLILLVWLRPTAEQALSVPMPTDPYVLTSAVVVCIATTVAFALAPALRSASLNPCQGIAGAQYGTISPFQRSIQRSLVVAQVAGSLTLLTASSHLGSALQAAARQSVEDPTKVVIATIDTRPLGADPTAKFTFCTDLLRKATGLPGVASAGLGPPRLIWTFGKGRQQDNSLSVWRASDAARDGQVHLGGVVFGELFDVVGAKLLRGRPFTPADHESLAPRVAIVNRPFIEEVLKDEDIGSVIRVAGRREGARAAVPVTIVGVIDGVWESTYAARGRPVPAVYVPVPIGEYPASLSLYIRIRDDAAKSLISGIRNAVAETSGAVSISAIGTLEEINTNVMPEVTLAKVGKILSIVALFLAAFGLYGLMAYFVATKRRDIAVRVAVGASGTEVFLLTLGSAFRLVMIGGSIGCVAAFVVGRVIVSSLSGTSDSGIRSLLLSSAVMIAITGLAAVPPALRAAWTDPIDALRSQ